VNGVVVVLQAALPPHLYGSFVAEDISPFILNPQVKYEALQLAV